MISQYPVSPVIGTMWPQWLLQEDRGSKNKRFVYTIPLCQGSDQLKPDTAAKFFIRILAACCWIKNCDSRWQWHQEGDGRK